MNEACPNQPIDMQRMLDTAVAFFLAGERCQPELAFGHYPTHSVRAPVVTNYTLAIQISLKILNRHYGNPANGHDLHHLFESLPEDSRAHLIYLEDSIEASRKAFVEWRYPYEYQFLSGNLNWLRRAFIVVHREVRRTLPNLESVYEKNWGIFDPDWTWAWPELEIPAAEKALGND